MSDDTPSISILPTAPPQPGPGGTAVAAPQDSTKSAVFGLVFVLNGKDVPITTANIKDAATKGAEFEVPDPVDLGTIQNIIDWINTTFNVSIPSADNLPSPLNTVVTNVLNATFTVRYFHVKIPPKGSTDGVKYTLDMAATLKAPVDLIPNTQALQIKGAVFGVTNEPPATP